MKSIHRCSKSGCIIISVLNGLLEFLNHIRVPSLSINFPRGLGILRVDFQSHAFFLFSLISSQIDVDYRFPIPMSHFGDSNNEIRAKLTQGTVCSM
jgi:hypothetical protein